jgi:hypothetical protein
VNDSVGVREDGYVGGRSLLTRDDGREARSDVGGDSRESYIVFGDGRKGRETVQTAPNNLKYER